MTFDNNNKKCVWCGGPGTFRDYGEAFICADCAMAYVAVCKLHPEIPPPHIRIVNHSKKRDGNEQKDA